MRVVRMSYFKNLTLPQARPYVVAHSQTAQLSGEDAKANAYRTDLYLAVNEHFIKTHAIDADKTMVSTWDTIVDETDEELYTAVKGDTELWECAMKGSESQDAIAELMAIVDTFPSDHAGAFAQLHAVGVDALFSTFTTYSSRYESNASLSRLILRNVEGLTAEPPSSRERPCVFPLSWAPPRPGPGGRPRTASPNSVRQYEARKPPEAVRQGGHRESLHHSFRAFPFRIHKAGVQLYCILQGFEHAQVGRHFASGFVSERHIGTQHLNGTPHDFDGLRALAVIRVGGVCHDIHVYGFSTPLAVLKVTPYVGVIVLLHCYHKVTHGGVVVEVPVYDSVHLAVRILQHARPQVLGVVLITRHVLGGEAEGGVIIIPVWLLIEGRPHPLSRNLLQLRVGDEGGHLADELIHGFII